MFNAVNIVCIVKKKTLIFSKASASGTQSSTPMTSRARADSAFFRKALHAFFPNEKKFLPSSSGTPDSPPVEGVKFIQELQSLHDGSVNEFLRSTAKHSVANDGFSRVAETKSKDLFQAFLSEVSGSSTVDIEEAVNNPTKPPVPFLGLTIVQNVGFHGLTYEGKMVEVMGGATKALRRYEIDTVKSTSHELTGEIS